MSAPRTTEPMVEGWRPPPRPPSPRLGWLVLAIVVLVVVVGGWWIVDSLEHRAPRAPSPSAEGR